MPRILVLILVLLAVGGALLGWVAIRVVKPGLPPKASGPTHVGSATCAMCHRGEHAAWRGVPEAGGEVASPSTAVGFLYTLSSRLTVTVSEPACNKVVTR